MTPNIDTDQASSLQREYYRETAQDYDAMHPRDEHLAALQHVARFLRAIGAKSVLDTGCGTGLAMRTLQAALPDVLIHGNDPSQPLLDIASRRFGIDPARLDCASSERLPYGDGEFDAVVETGKLHHVAAPEKVIAEMLRVARLGVFISDDNFFGSGRLYARVGKFVLARTGLLGYVYRLRRGGHEWLYSPVDGVAWSYSVFDSTPQLAAAGAQVLVLPTSPPGSWAAQAAPLLFASHCLVVALKGSGVDALTSTNHAAPAGIN
jgi:ubiquinone/menaquinone biosynthesis C-methylase UbiE